MYSYQKKTTKIKKFFTLFFLIITVSAVSIFLYDIYANIDISNYEIERTATAERINNIGGSEENKEKTIAEAANCIVGISKIKNTGASIFNVNSTQELGLGSGFVISDNGYILTNWHVVGNKYSTCYITLANGKIYNGSVVWADRDLDLGLVKISANGLDYLSFADSENLNLGENVYAIGNPIGVEFQRTVTAGIISGLNRTIKVSDEYGESYMEDLIQTDATINEGNSGGPLINKDGEVIGINTVKIESAEGIGFAIPINIIKPVLESFINNGRFNEAYLGVFAYDKEAIPYLNSTLELETGVYIAKISTDGPAIKTDLKTGDIITKVDEKTINKMSELREYIYRKNVGDEIVLTILRNKKEINVKIILGEK